jgi:uncharacterized repeat protein (TIGR04052 family)
MQQHPLICLALISSLIAAASSGCGDGGESDGSGGSAGAAPSAGEGNSSGESSGGRGGTSGRGGSSGEGNTSGESGAGGADGGGGAPPLCDELGALCEPYDLGPGPQRDCSAVAREGDEEVCEEQEAACREACETAEEIPFALTFAAIVGSETFDCGATYTGIGADDSTVHPVDFRFYVHDIRMIDDSGAEVPVSLTQDGLWQYEGVALLDFEDRSGTCSNGTVELNDTVVGTVPFGTYTGVAYKLGVPFELNHTDIATAPSPLNLSAMFWSWNTGRMFISVINSAELDGGDRFGTILQLGSTGCNGDPASGGVVSCTKPNRGEYDFPTFRAGQDVVLVDMKELLKNSNVKTDQCHSFQEECAPMFEELGIDWTTGAPSSSQSVFRME